MPLPLLPPVVVPVEDVVSLGDEAVPVIVSVAVACDCDVVASVGVTVGSASEVDDAVCAVPRVNSEKLQSRESIKWLRIFANERVKSEVATHYEPSRH